jgi:class 3 adenylate cyclase
VPALREHIGVATGQVVASGIGVGGRRAYGVTGDSVNLASRLTDAAAAGEILISEAVRRTLAEQLNCVGLADEAKRLGLAIARQAIEDARGD